MLNTMQSFLCSQVSWMDRKTRFPEKEVWSFLGLKLGHSFQGIEFQAKVKVCYQSIHASM